MGCADSYLRLLDAVAARAIACGRRPVEITLVAVTKGQPAASVAELWAAGCRDFGESRVQEFLPKKREAACPESRWHFIGTLQKNKAAKVIGECSLLHSVDSLSLAQKISSLSLQAACKTAILLEVNISCEATKHGFEVEKLHEAFEQLLLLPGIDVQGLMTMAPAEAPEAVIAACFGSLRELAFHYKLPILSMGMSEDFTIAIEQGATLLRIGSKIFS